MTRPPPWTDGPRDAPLIYCCLFTFSVHTVTGRRREAGRRSGQPQDSALSLQPKKRARLPSPALPPSPPSCFTYHAIEGGAVLPLRPLASLAQCLLSISLPSGTVPTFPLTGLLWEWAQFPPLRKHLGPSLQPLWRPLVSSESATVWVKRALPLPLPLRDPAGRRGSLPLCCHPVPLSAPE